MAQNDGRELCMPGKISQIFQIFWKNSLNEPKTQISLHTHLTLVGLSTRPAPLIISKSLQFRTFWSQSKALFMIRCMLSVGSGSKMFGALKVTIYVKFFKLSVHKMSTFLRISACQWTMPSGLFAKKSHSKFFCSC